MTVRTKEQALFELGKIKEFAGDIESDHSAADEVLCDLLRALGYAEVVEAWLKIDKWYA